MCKDETNTKDFNLNKQRQTARRSKTRVNEALEDAREKEVEIPPVRMKKIVSYEDESSEASPNTEDQ
jgi:hypothetical protein